MFIKDVEDAIVQARRGGQFIELMRKQVTKTLQKELEALAIHLQATAILGDLDPEIEKAEKAVTKQEKVLAKAQTKAEKARADRINAQEEVRTKAGLEEHDVLVVRAKQAEGEENVALAERQGEGVRLRKAQEYLAQARAAKQALGTYADRPETPLWDALRDAA